MELHHLKEVHQPQSFCRSHRYDRTCFQLLRLSLWKVWLRHRYHHCYQPQIFPMMIRYQCGLIQVHRPPSRRMTTVIIFSNHSNHSAYSIKQFPKKSIRFHFNSKNSICQLTTKLFKWIRKSTSICAALKIHSQNYSIPNRLRNNRVKSNWRFIHSFEIYRMCSVRFGKLKRIAQP